MARINPYLNFRGNCEEAFRFYRSVFGGDFAYLGRYRDMPEDPTIQLTDEEKEKIMHISLPIDAYTRLMGSDSVGEWGPKTIMGNNIHISITAQSKQEADRIFKGLSDEGKITMPMDDTFWGDYFGMCTDRFDIHWMVSYSENQ